MVITISVKQGLFQSTGADPARVHVHHFVSEYMFIVCSVLEAPECLGKSRVHSQYYKTDYRVHPEC